MEASWKYNKKKHNLIIRLMQKRAGHGGLFHVPMELAAVNAKGKDIPTTCQTVEITGKQLDLKFRNIPEPFFISFNRDCSFYGTFNDKSASREQLVLQVQKDPNKYNRVEAMRRLTDLERIKLINNTDALISKDWISLYEMILKDMSLSHGLKAYLLRIDEQSLDRKYLPFYRERYAARITLLKTITGRCMPALMKAFKAVDTYARPRNPKDGIEERVLKSILLRTIVEANKSETHELAEKHFHRAWNITDKSSTLHCINVSEHPRRRELMEEGYNLWKDHLSAYSSYLGVVGSGIHDDVFDMIALEEKRSTFKIQHPTHSRGLYLPMSSNNKMLWTDRGIEWMTNTAIKVAEINENTVIRMIAAFQQVDKLANDLKQKVLKALKTMRAGIDQSAAPSVAGRISDYLESAGK
ncbi:MAG: DUF3458 domain-containing protein [Kiritimatiellae bacterium]|nr:DUF3458 domain-containing protein [Kiritimatiellia bacterium]